MSNIDTIINAHPHLSLAELIIAYELLAQHCEQWHKQGEPIPADGHGDWQERAAEAAWIATELRKR